MVTEIVVSRVDVYADVEGLELVHSDMGRFVSRGVARRIFEVSTEAHQRGRRLSGFVFGRGDVVARVYDKTVEMAASGDTWPALFWQGRQADGPVWRVEFQFRRRALGSFALRGAAEVFAARQSLWDYGTEWLSLRAPTAHERQARWPEDPAWEAVGRARVGMPADPLVRRRVAAADETVLVRGWAGYTSALAARGDGDEFTAALARAVPAAREHLEKLGRRSPRWCGRSGLAAALSWVSRRDYDLPAG
ncbi:MAG: hypothetical protein ACYDAY_06610 [Candidatus Dormibacteria bacterium]